MTPEQKLAMSIALELKHLIGMKLCGHISLEQFRSRRAVLLESYRSISCWNIGDDDELEPEDVYETAEESLV